MSYDMAIRILSSLWKGFRLSAPEPYNPFEPVPEDRPEDWREDPDED